MAITNQQRTDLHNCAREHWGKEMGDTLMELLPTQDWSEFATKKDVESSTAQLLAEMRAEFAHFRADLAQEFAKVRVEMAAEFAKVRSEMAEESAAIRHEMKTEFAAVRSEMKTEFSAVRSEMKTGSAEVRAETNKRFTGLTRTLLAILIPMCSGFAWALWQVR